MLLLVQGVDAIHRGKRKTDAGCVGIVLAQELLHVQGTNAHMMYHKYSCWEHLEAVDFHLACR